MDTTPSVIYIVKGSREEALEDVSDLQKNGWDVYNGTLPLSGQEGYHCVKTEYDEDGNPIQTVKNIVWNLYESELTPIVMKCEDENHLYSFILQHAKHEGFGFIDWNQGDGVGFVCHCKHKEGQSIALHVEKEAQHTFNEAAINLILAYMLALEEAMDEDKEIVN